MVSAYHVLLVHPSKKAGISSYQIHVGSLGFLLWQLIYFCRGLDIRVSKHMWRYIPFNSHQFRIFFQHQAH